MTGNYKLAGSFFPKDPITKNWTRQRLGMHGTSEPIFSVFWQLELRFGSLESSDIAFWENKYQAGGLYPAQLPHPLTGVQTGFTGVSIETFEHTFNDVDRNFWTVDARLVLGRINLSATGTV